MALDQQLLEILACPEDKGPLLYFESEDCLYNPRLKRKYAIKDDIPIMLIDEAEALIAGLPAHEDIENVVVLGMGGSGIVGDLMLAVAGPFMSVPLVVCKS